MATEPEVWEISDDSSETGTEGDRDSEQEIEDSNDDDQIEESIEIDARNNFREDYEDDDEDDDDEEDKPDSDTENYPPDDLKTGLRDYLESLEIGGQFAHHGPIVAAPNPGLFLLGHGTVGFPLCQYDFDKIIAASSNVKHLTSSTDNAALTLPKQHWSVPESQFRLMNPAWSSMLQSIMTQIQVELGLGDRKFRPILVELVLYEAGSTLEAYQSSLKTPPSSFALVDIVLPSKRTDGGDITYTFGNQIRKLSMPQVSEWDCSYLTRFTDISIKSPPLDSGKRLILRYALEQTSPGPRCSAGNIASSLNDLGSMLRSWNKNRDVFEDYLAYVLEDNYGDNLAHEDLKGKDRFIVDQLKSLAEDLGFYVCLAKLQCEIEGETEAEYDEYDDCWDSESHHDMENINEKHFTLEQVFTLDGQDECVKPRFDEDMNLLQGDDIFDGQEPDSEEYDKYEGHLTHYHRASVVLLMPRDFRMEFLLSNVDPADRKRNITTFIQKLPPKLSNIPKELQADLKYLCGELVKQMHSLPQGSVPYSLSESAFLRILEAIVELDLKDLCELAMPAYFLNDGGIPWITKMTEKHGVPWCKTIITNCISNITKFNARCRLIAKVSEFLQNPEWSLAQYELSVSSLDLNTPKDTENLLQIAKTWNEKQLIKIVVPSIKKSIKKTEAMFPLLTNIAKVRLASEVISEPLDIVFQEVFIGTVGVLGLEQHDEVDTPPPCPTYQTYSYPYNALLDNRQKETPGYRNLSWVICFAYRLGMNLELEQLFLKIALRAAEANESAFPGRFLSFLRCLASTVYGHMPVGLEISSFQHLFQNILSSCVEKTMFREPRPPTDWKRQKRGCGCNDCKNLDAFLQNPNKVEETFHINGDRRKHLRAQLSKDCYDPQKSIALSETKIKSPFGLIVKKILDYHYSRVTQWEKDRETMRKTIREVAPPADLQKLLGQYYDALVVQGVPIAEPRPGQTPLSALAHGSLVTAGSSTPVLNPLSGNATAGGSSNNNNNKKRSAPSGVSVDGNENEDGGPKKKQKARRKRW